MPELRRRWQALQDRIAAGCAAAGRSAAAVRVIAVTKGLRPELVADACRLGLTELGENRLQDALPRMEALAATGLEARWHFIGRLQSNKAAKVVEAFDTVDSVDDLALAERLNRAALSLGRRLPVLLQVNTAADPAKQGFSPEALPAAAARVLELPGLTLEGLMTIGRLDADAGAQAESFTLLATLRRDLAAQLPATPLPRLSMGMSGDLDAALAAGATELRIGSLLFAGLDPVRFDAEEAHG